MKATRCVSGKRLVTVAVDAFKEQMYHAPKLHTRVFCMFTSARGTGMG